MRQRRREARRRRQRVWLYAACGYGVQFLAIALVFPINILGYRLNDPQHAVGVWLAGFSALLLSLSLLGFGRRLVFGALQTLTVIAGLFFVFSIPDTWFLYLALVLGAALTARGNRLFRLYRSGLVPRSEPEAGSPVTGVPRSRYAEYLFDFDENFLQQILPELHLRDERLQARYDAARSNVAEILGISLDPRGVVHRRRNPEEPTGRGGT